VDVTFGDLIDYLGQDSNTKSIMLYVESLANARTFMSAARAFARKNQLLYTNLVGSLNLRQQQHHIQVHWLRRMLFMMLYSEEQV